VCVCVCVCVCARVCARAYNVIVITKLYNGMNIMMTKSEK